METPTKGYTMPLSVNKRKTLVEFATFAVVLLALVFLYDLKAIDDGIGEDLRRKMRAFCIMIMIPFVGIYLVRYFGMIHFVPQGIAVTLWGRTIRRLPAEQIRFVSAIHYTEKGTTYEKIAVCGYDQEELTALYKKKTPKMFQNSREIWFGEWARAVLIRRYGKLRGEFNMDSHILWLEWDCERLEALLKMYPNAQWLDCTQKKIFDERLNRR